MAEAGFDFMSILPLVLIFIVFYFLLIRPQQKQMKERKAMLAALSKGDHVVTNGGIMGKITAIDEHDILSVEIAKGVEVKVMRAMVSSVAAKTDAVSVEADEKPAAKKKAPAKKPAAKKKAPAKKAAKK